MDGETLSLEMLSHDLVVAWFFWRVLTTLNSEFEIDGPDMRGQLGFVNSVIWTAFVRNLI